MVSTHSQVCISCGAELEVVVLSNVTDETAVWLAHFSCSYTLGASVWAMCLYVQILRFSYLVHFFLQLPCPTLYHFALSTYSKYLKITDDDIFIIYSLGWEARSDTINTSKKLSFLSAEKHVVLCPTSWASFCCLLCCLSNLDVGWHCPGCPTKHYLKYHFKYH